MSVEKYLQPMYDKGCPVYPHSKNKMVSYEDIDWSECGVFYCYRTGIRTHNENIEFYCYIEGTISDNWWVITVGNSNKFYVVETFDDPLDNEFETFDSALLYLRMVST